MLAPANTSGAGGGQAIEFNSAFPEAFGAAAAASSPEGNDDLAFSTKDNPFAGLKGTLLWIGA